MKSTEFMAKVERRMANRYGVHITDIGWCCSSKYNDVTAQFTTAFDTPVENRVTYLVWIVDDTLVFLYKLDQIVLDTPI